MIVHENTWRWGKSDTLVLAEGRAFCTVSIETDEPSVAFLSHVSVYEPYRRQGLGNMLLRAAEEYARKRGAREICLWADPDEWPIEWYKRKGYVIYRNGKKGYIALKKSLK